MRGFGLQSGRTDLPHKGGQGEKYSNATCFLKGVYDCAEGKYWQVREKEKQGSSCLDENVS